MIISDRCVPAGQRVIRSVTALGLAAGLVLAGCGDDEGASKEYEQFCAAELAIERASMGDDEAALGTAMDNLVAAAPNDDTRQKVQATIDAFMALQGPPDEAFNAAYGEVMAIVKDECGFHQVSVTAEDYKFSGVDRRIDAGPTVFTFDNDGTEYHELLVLRRNDGVDQPVEELLALDEETVSSMITDTGAAFAGPGTTSYTAIDLQPGKYIAICFIPTGLTTQVFDEMMATGAEPQGQPHAMNGMIAEFEVTS